MADDESKPVFITPPPGLLPSRPVPPPEEQKSAIPVHTDSATRRMPAREPVSARPSIPFKTPAMTPPAAPPVAEAIPAESAADNDETQFVVRPATPSWRLVLPSGEHATVSTALFIGRNPARTAGDVHGELLAVDDTTKSVSKTHALVEVIDGDLFVTDLNSTNGVYVTAESVDGVPVTPQQRTPVPAGSDIELGTFLIQVERG